MSSGTVSVGSISISQDCIKIEQLYNVDASSPAHNNVIVYNDNAIDSSGSDGWVAKALDLENLGNVYAASAPDHNSILAWNTGTGWVNRSAETVFDYLSESKSKQDQFVVFEGSTSVCSFEDGNHLYKKEVSDSDFSFAQNIEKGVVATINYGVGTVLRSSKGFSALPSVVPGRLALRETRFYLSTAPATIGIVSMGAEAVLNLYQSDNVLSQGPVTVPSGGSTTLEVSVVGEYYLESDGFVLCGIKESGVIRPAIPMAAELLGFNTNAVVTASSTPTTAVYHRGNSTTGTFTVSSSEGSFGSDDSFASTGALIVRGDGPISARFESTSFLSLDELSQCFGLPSSVSVIAAISKYSGSASVYDAGGVLVGSFDILRDTAATTVAQQLYPASGKWENTVSLVGGYVVTNVPSSVYADSSLLFGGTPEPLRAEIRLDQSGLARRRDVDSLGVVSWSVC
ncbi:unknown [Feldmannia species virus]|uniref:Uncharacterized protein n=1 Tax=Feldmannia species virus TaxID=39420 RepID=B5LWA0_9PHYC|nr:hypothetical protein FeldSpV_gp011 [Feldmannia species virus]ACH46763.1 unknown [Feldmannia species virus]